MEKNKGRTACSHPQYLGDGNNIQAELGKDGQDDYPKEVGVSLHPLPRVEYQSIALNEVLHIAIGDKSVILGEVQAKTLNHKNDQD
jgi:hypothetical protein